ncbi:MAG: glycosyltransferase [Nitrospinae bacterium]|nr:glycosyltransferase [Nitrospinota bacterium]
MPNTPLISIVTPSYNHSEFIEETIESVLSQDYPEIEYIVIDGGSTDNTIGILKKYEGKIKWVSEKDRGQSDAINKGFRMAKGGIFAWLNSDDIYIKGAVSKAAALLNANPDVDMIYGKAMFCNESGKIIGDYNPPEIFDYKMLAVSNSICQPSTFFRRDAFFAAGGIDLTLHYLMDHDLWMKMAKRFKIAYLPEFLSIYRLHTESKTVSDIHGLKRNRESINIRMIHYGWAPANHVYSYCYYLVKNKIPSYLAKFRFLIIFITLLISPVEYVRLNKGIRLDDIKMINLLNIKKLFFKGWELKDLMK